MACISLGTEKIRLTLDYQSEGRILLPWVLWIPVFKKLQVKVRELWKQVLKREKRNMWITRNRELRVLPVGVVYDSEHYGYDAAKIIRAPFFGK